MANVTWVTPLDGSSQLSNVLTKTDSDSWLNANNYTTDSSSLGSESTLTIKPITGGNVRLGYVDGTPPAYDSNYLFSLQFGSQAEVFENNVHQYTFPTGYSDGDEFQIKITSGGTVSYLKNGVVGDTSDTAFSGTRVLGSSAYTQGSVSDLTLGAPPPSSGVLLPPPLGVLEI